MADNLKGIPFSSDDEGIDFPTRARRIVALHATPDDGPLTLGEVYVVWFAYVRGCWKAVLSTSRPDGRLYEVSSRTDDGTSRVFLDTYVKTGNQSVV